MPCDGLCFNCPEKFTWDHNCTKKGLYLMELHDDAPTNDAAAKEPTSDDNVAISLHALMGIKTTDTMHLAASVAGAFIRALVDSGSTHSFIAVDTARRLGL
jgi:predicted aspartyl protease